MLRSLKHWLILKSGTTEQRHWRLASLFLLLIIAGSILGLARPIYAAMELNYFEVLVEGENVTVEWSTASEHEVLGFELYIKEEAQSQSQYQLLGEQVAQGNQDSGAVYRIEVTDNLSTATSYCFRLKEVTLNNDRGEIIDRCGYGRYITPTPSTTTAEATAVATVSITPTIAISLTEPLTNSVPMSPTVVQPIVVTTTPVLSTTITPETNSSEPQLPDTTIPTLMPTEQVSPNPGAESPLPTPTPLSLNQENNEEVALAASSVMTNIDASVAPLETATQSFTESSTEQLLATDTAIANPPYIVLTVTPNREIAEIAPTFTPFPTTIASEETTVIAAILPNTQNLMIVLLCGVFSGASGLGILGLVSTLLYMRSRNADDTRKAEKGIRHRNM